MTISVDMQITSLRFTQSNQKRDAIDVQHHARGGAAVQPSAIIGEALDMALAGATAAIPTVSDMVPLKRQLGGRWEPAAEHSGRAAGLQFFQLPVRPDQGLPQAFSCTVGATDYDFGVYANLDGRARATRRRRCTTWRRRAARQARPTRPATWCCGSSARARTGRR